MKRFSHPIPEDVRNGMSICPPPLYDKNGVMLEYPPKMVQKYKDFAMMKEGTTIYVDEELDTYNHPGTKTRYRMTVRCLPFIQDIELIMLAARHMDMVSDYTIESCHRENLDPMFESAYLDVSYDVANVQTEVDNDTTSDDSLIIDYKKVRRRIWNELFLAAGYRAVWGNRVYNVRRRQL